MSEKTGHKRKHYGGDKKSHFFKRQNKNFLVAGQRGFLATCNFREKECGQDCLKILNQYADQMYGENKDDDSITDAADAQTENKDPESGDNEEEPEDIATSLQKEIDKSTAANRKKSFRFYSVDTGVQNCIFIRTTLKDPVGIVEKIVSDISESRKQVSRFILRFIPVEIVCKASMDDILAAAGRLFDKYFLPGPPVTFSIVFNRRYNNDLGRDRVYAELADLVKFKNVNHQVDLKKPQKTVIVEVIKGLCCLSVVSEYLHFRKFNLLELALQKAKETDPGQSTESKTEAETADAKQSTDNIESETSKTEEK